MWSIGCTLYELYTGKILFTGDSNNQMLKAIMEIRGRLTPKLYKRGQLSVDHFDEQGQFVSIERDKVLGKVRCQILWNLLSLLQSGGFFFFSFFSNLSWIIANQIVRLDCSQNTAYGKTDSRLAYSSHGSI